MKHLDFFHHVFIDNKADKTLFLLHGTGGSEHDLLPLVKELSDHYNFVGVRGNVSERGMARFFERDEFGVFNQDSISRETKKLSEFIQAWMETHALTTENTAFLGYSNGATMIVAVAFYYPQLVKTAVTLHPMLPFKPGTINLSQSQFLVSYGDNDQLIPAGRTKELIQELHSKGAVVEVVSHAGGHELQKLEVDRLQRFLTEGVSNTG